MTCWRLLSEDYTIYAEEIQVARGDRRIHIVGNGLTNCIYLGL